MMVHLDLRPAESRILVRRPHAKRRDVQGLRAVAVLAVILFHAGVPLTGGFVGVDIFFVISGYVITSLLLREHESAGRIKLLRFYAKRTRRLIPAMALTSVVTLAITAVATSPLGPNQVNTGRAAAAASAFAANAYLFLSTGGYFEPRAASDPFLHTWSLSVEEQFYLVFPTLMFLVLLMGRGGRKQLSWILMAVGVPSLLLCVAFSYRSILALTAVNTLFSIPPDVALSFAFYGTPLRAWEFVVGAFIASRRSGGKSSRLLTWVGAATMLGSVSFIHQGEHFPGALAIFPVAGTALMLAPSSQDGTEPLPRRLLSSRPMVWLGDRSYSWYLWHWPLIVFAHLWFAESALAPLLMIPVSLLVASIAYEFVERPIHLGIWPQRRGLSVVMALVAIALPGGLGLSLAYASGHGWGDAEIQKIQTLTAPEHADLTGGCVATAPLGDPSRRECIWKAPHPKGTILLIGDSNAGHFTEPVIRVGNDLGYDVQVVTFGGCPLIYSVKYPTPECRSFVTESVQAIQARTPAYAAVVVSNASWSYTSGPERDNYVRGPGRDRASEWARLMTKTVRAMAVRSGVVVVGAVPQYLNIPECLRPTLWSHASAGCGELRSTSEQFIERRKFLREERRATEPFVSSYLDTADRLCTDDGCSVRVGGQLVYKDSAHLSVEGAQIFVPLFRQAVERAVRDGSN